MKRSLIIILVTVLLDIIGLGIVIPILPFIVKGYGFSEFYVGLTLSVFSLGMFFGGISFGKLSDVLGRNRTLEITISLNIIGYILFAISTNLWFFIFARFIGGLGASGFAVGQAYISDISNDNNRIRNMGLIGAMFGIGFIIGPIVGGILSSFGNNLNIVGFFSAFIAFLNLLLVVFKLPKIKLKKVGFIKEMKFKITNKAILILFFVSFITALGFSAMQSTFPLVMIDRFKLDSRHIGYLFGFIGFIGIIYQGLLIKYVKRLLEAYEMIVFGLFILIIGFLLFSFNNIFILVYFIIFMFPVGYGTINPSIAGMQSKLGANHVGKILGLNASMISLGNIIGPFIAGSLYLIWSGLPYIISSILFFVAFLVILLNKRAFTN